MEILNFAMVMELLPKNVSAVLITKESVYPERILESVRHIGFGEVIIRTNCTSVSERYDAIAKAKYDIVYIQDDDCIAPIKELLDRYDGSITCAMTRHHLEFYKDSRICLLGWGAIFPKDTCLALDMYLDEFGEDYLFEREADRILTYANFPQNRLELPIINLENPDDTTRLSKQPEHYSNLLIIENRLKSIWK